MATQTRVPGAASSEVDFELERFERTAEDRLEIAGRWYGLRGRRFVRPVLNLNTGGTRRRAIALLEHKPWAADDGKTWLAAFRWPDGAGEIESAELEVGPGLIVALPAPGGEANTAVRVSALRPARPDAAGPQVPYRRRGRRTRGRRGDRRRPRVRGPQRARRERDRRRSEAPGLRSRTASTRAPRASVRVGSSGRPRRRAT